MSAKNVLITIVCVCFAALNTGCALVASATTKRDSEKIKKAEFNIAQTQGKIAVIVNMNPWIKAPADLRRAITRAFNTAMETKAGIEKDRLLEYNQIRQAKTNLNNSTDIFAVAEKLGADYILDVEIVDFSLATFAEKDFYNGSLKIKTTLYNKEKLIIWPVNQGDASKSRTEFVGIEAEKGTVNSSVQLLSAAAAHCTVRYLYDCEYPKFRIAEEQKQYDDYTW